MFSLASLDPRTKMVMIAAISTAAMITDNIWWLLGLMFFTVIFMALGGISPAAQIRQGKGALSLVLFLFILQALFGNWQLGAMLCIRLLIVIMSALILLTGRSTDYLLGLTKWKVPYEIAYMVIIGFHFFPILKQEAGDVYQSIQLRGKEVKKAGIAGRLKIYKRISLPILMGALERAKDTSISMEARCFRLYPYRTYLREIRLRKKDWVLMLLIPVLSLGFCLGAKGVFGGLPEGWGLPKAATWLEEKTYPEVVEFKKVEKKETSNFSFLYMGDVQYMIRERDYEKWGDMADMAAEKNPDARFVIMGGDMVEKNGDIEDYATFFREGEGLFDEVPLIPVPGNHETSVTPHTYLEIMDLPDNGPPEIEGEIYSIDYGSVHVTALNSCLFMEERKNDKGEEYWEKLMHKVDLWIKGDLESSAAKHKIVVLHHPPYPLSEDDSIYEEIRTRWVPLFEEGGVELVLCGHQHVYMRTGSVNGIVYLMANSGQKNTNYYEEGDVIPEYVEEFIPEGSTYQVIRVKGNRLTVDTYDSKGKKADSFSIEGQGDDKDKKRGYMRSHGI